MNKKNSGITAVPLIFALLLMTAIGAFFISLMFGRHLGAPLLAQTTKAFYIADAGIEFAEEFLKGFVGNVDWTTALPDNIPGDPPDNTIAFGGGTFAVAFSNKTQDSVIATSTGTIGNAVRVIAITFTRQAVLIQKPVNWVSKIEIEEDVTVDNISPCPECECDGPTDISAECDPDCRVEPCAHQVILADAPPPTLPPDAPPFSSWPRVRLPDDSLPQGVTFEGGSYTFDAGTYFFDRLEIRDGANVTVKGPVAIWILDEFEMKDNSQFNRDGNAADLLLLSAGGPEGFEPEFEIEDAKFRGAIYAPIREAEVELDGGNSSDNDNDNFNGTNTDNVNTNENNNGGFAEVIGTITGDEVELEDARITFAPTAGINAVIIASGWREM